MQSSWLSGNEDINLEITDASCDLKVLLMCVVVCYDCNDRPVQSISEYVIELFVECCVVGS